MNAKKGYSLIPSSSSPPGFDKIISTSPYISLKILSKNNSFVSNTSSISQNTTSNTNNNSINQILVKPNIVKTTNEEQGHLIELLNKAQNFSLEDQRGRIDTKHLELPELKLKPWIH